MSSNDPSLDRDSFQQFLANAYAVQESQIDREMLSAIMEVQRMVTRGDLGLDGAMNLVVDSARDVAHADGIAIGLLEGDQLIYRAGSGSSIDCVGSHVTASLTVSPNTRTSREILRVEDAGADRRIEASICRQLGAESIIILPIYSDRDLVGVLEVLFSEAHPFEDREVRTYRLMSGLIETALSYAKNDERKENLFAGTTSAKDQVPLHTGEFLRFYSLLSYSRWDNIRATGANAFARARVWAAARKPESFSKLANRKVAEFRAPGWRRNAAFGAASVVLFALAWAAYPTKSVPQGTLVGSPAANSQPGSGAVKATDEGLAVDGDNEATLVPVKQAGFRSNTIRRKRMGRDEIDYVGDDVTVRHFYPKLAPQRRTAAHSRVSYIGEDVTVHYFTPGEAEKAQRQ